MDMDSQEKVKSRWTRSFFTTLNWQNDDERFVCDICHKDLASPSSLTLHRNTHVIERRYKCEPCQVSFHSQGHLQKHMRSSAHETRVEMTQAFGIPTSDNPRPYGCHECDVAFRKHGHLAKHLRSKSHITKMEANGLVPMGTYAALEKCGAEIRERLVTTNCELSLQSLRSIAMSLIHPSAATYNTPPAQHSMGKSRHSSLNGMSHTQLPGGGGGGGGGCPMGAAACSAATALVGANYQSPMAPGGVGGHHQQQQQQPHPHSQSSAYHNHPQQQHHSISQMGAMITPPPPQVQQTTSCGYNVEQPMIETDQSIGAHQPPIGSSNTTTTVCLPLLQPTDLQIQQSPGCGWLPGQPAMHQQQQQLLDVELAGGCPPASSYTPATGPAEPGCVSPHRTASSSSAAYAPAAHHNHHYQQQHHQQQQPQLGDLMVGHQHHSQPPPATGPMGPSMGPYHGHQLMMQAANYELSNHYNNIGNASGGGGSGLMTNVMMNQRDLI